MPTIRQYPIPAFPPYDVKPLHPGVRTVGNAFCQEGWREARGTRPGMRKTKGLKKGSGPICEGTLPVGNGTPNLDRGSGRIGDSRGSKTYRFSIKILKKSNDLEPRGGSGPVGADGGERPGPQQYRFLVEILLKSIDFERQGRSEQAAGSGRDKKSIVFLLKSF